MKKLLVVIIITVLIGLLLFRPLKTNEGLAVEGLTSDEAIKNIASIYNTDKMAVTNLNVTGEEVANSIKTGKLQLGNKWVLTGSGKDTAGVDDDWLRFNDASGKYYGGIAVGKLYDVSAGGQLSSVISGLQGSINGVQGNVNARLGKSLDCVKCVDGWDVWEGPTNGIDQCAQTCQSNGRSLCALLRKSDNHCWCKSVVGLNTGVDCSFQSRILL
jgi:hypothetical protein